jgi:hypothetical protein
MASGGPPQPRCLPPLAGNSSASESLRARWPAPHPVTMREANAGDGHLARRGRERPTVARLPAQSRTPGESPDCLRPAGSHCVVAPRSQPRERRPPSASSGSLGAGTPCAAVAQGSRIPGNTRGPRIAEIRSSGCWHEECYLGEPCAQHGGLGRRLASVSACPREASPRSLARRYLSRRHLPPRRVPSTDRERFGTVGP